MGLKGKDELQAYKEKSKGLLEQLIEKAVRTTMVGTLSKLEEEFGHLWGHDGSEMDVDKIKNKEIFDRIRKHIFDTGHNQIKVVKEELKTYDVVWNRHVLQMKVKPINKEEAKED